MRAQVLGVLALMVLGCVGTAIGRECHDITGKCSREADIVDVRDGRVYVKTPDGRDASVAIERLSADDRAYIKQIVDQRNSASPFQQVAMTTFQSKYALLKPSPDSVGETLPAPMTASYVADATQDQAAAAATTTFDFSKYPSWAGKYAYFTCCGTFHLVDFGPTSGIGTAHYCCQPCNQCDSCCRPWYLVVLAKWAEDKCYFYYRPFFGPANVDMWRFARCPDCCCCKYSVCYHVTGTPWDKWCSCGCGDRVTPK